MVTIDKDLIQCPGCHNYVSPNDLVCADCRTVLPKGLEMRQARGGMTMSRDRAEALAAYERQKLEMSHVPRWLRRLSAAVDHADEDPSVHRFVQWGSGLIGFGLVFEMVDPLIPLLPVSTDLATKLYLPLQIMAGLLAFSLTSHFIFTIFRNIVGGLRQVFGEEQDARILQGTTDEKIARLKKKQ
jgi:hypothetical protein